MVYDGISRDYSGEKMFGPLSLSLQIDYRVNIVVRDYVLLTSLWLFYCLPNFAWADDNWEEMADQMG